MPLLSPFLSSGTGSVGRVETQYLNLPTPVRLDCGRQLHPIRVAYETYGTLSPRRDNVILVAHALSGDAHAVFVAAAYLGGASSVFLAGGLCVAAVEP